MCRDTRKIIQSLHLHIYRIMPYSSFKTVYEQSYTCFTGIWGFGQFGQKIMWSDARKVFPCLCSTSPIKLGSALCQSPLKVRCYLFCMYLGIWAILGKWPQILQIILSDTRKVTRSLQLLISHQIRLYSCVKALYKLSYLFYRYLGIRAIGWNWAQIPQIMCRDPR